jgi:hypothetical protein
LLEEAVHGLAFLGTHVDLRFCVEGRGSEDPVGLPAEPLNQDDVLVYVPVFLNDLCAREGCIVKRLLTSTVLCGSRCMVMTRSSGRVGS